MSLLELRPLTDMDALKALYSDPYISRIGHDDRPAAPLIHEAVRYIGTYANGELVGAFLIIETGFIEIDAHALLSRRALEHSREFAAMCLKKLFMADPKIERINSYVVDGLTTARNYLLKIGFKTEGFRRDACRQGGKLLGLHMLGMTRKDWEQT